MTIQTIQELSKEIERGQKIYGYLKNVKNDSKVLGSGVNVETQVTFWVETKSREDAKALANKYREILYKSFTIEAENCFSLIEEVDGVVYRAMVYFTQQGSEIMKDLFQEYMKVRDKYPNMIGMTAYALVKAHGSLLTTEEIHILSRAHSASRAGIWPDTKSDLYEKRLLKQYNIGPVWRGPRCV